VLFSFATIERSRIGDHSAVPALGDFLLPNFISICPFCWVVEHSTRRSLNVDEDEIGCFPNFSTWILFDRCFLSFLYDLQDFKFHSTQNQTHCETERIHYYINPDSLIEGRSNGSYNIGNVSHKELITACASRI